MADTIDPDHINPGGTGYWQGCGHIRTIDVGGPTNPTPINPVFTNVAKGNVTKITGAPLFTWTANSTALTFSPGQTPYALSAENYFREPTLLLSGSAAGGTLQAAGSKNVMVPTVMGTNSYPADGQYLNLNLATPALNAQGMYCGLDKQRYLGMFYSALPLVWVTGTAIGSIKYRNDSFNQNYAATFRVQYQDKNNIWVSYDPKYFNPYDYGNAGKWAQAGYNLAPAASGIVPMPEGSIFFDPRIGRFAPTLACHPPDVSAPAPFSTGWLSALKVAAGTTNTDWPSPSYSGTWQRLNTGYQEPTAYLVSGWHAQSESNPNSGTNGSMDDMTFPGSETVNSPNFHIPGAAVVSGTNLNHYYSDPDGVVRRGMGAYYTSGTSGLPMLVASTYSGSSAQTTSSISQAQSRPIVLNRPFRNVGELGYVFSGTPWKNLDFFTPESGDAPLLDIFCVGESADANGRVAGKVDLNTRQAPVLQAIIAGACEDEQAAYNSPPPWNLNPMTSAQALASGTTLISRTTNTTTLGQGPLRNVSELVGKYTGINNAYGQPYDGFSNDLTAVFGANTQVGNIQRFREAPVRALASVGQTRVWNLMIDVVAQIGRYPAGASSLNNFVVEGEQRCWVHVAIDRLTGQIIDKQIEVVKE